MKNMWIGIDEAGVGTLAGPLVVSVVAMSKETTIEGVKDSKLMSDTSRENSVDAIHRNAFLYKTVFADVTQIDKQGIWEAWERLVLDLVFEVRGRLPAHEILIDGNRVLRGINKITPIVDGDRTHHCISAASVLAKYAQCCAMDDLHAEYPQYGFDRHRGYGTKEHLEKLKEYGACVHHRKSYGPVKNL